MTAKEEHDFFNYCKARNSLPPTTTAVGKLDIKKAVTDMQFHVPLDKAHNNFFGLPSNLTIYHTSPTWLLRSGSETQHVPKEARPVCIHTILLEHVAQAQRENLQVL
jgi:hypothetical protein